MKVDINELLLFFDELSDLTNEELKMYWFKSKRVDGLVITFVVSLFDSTVDIGINNNSGVNIASLLLKKCSAIKILDEKKKCLEILCNEGMGRCFLSLLGTSILRYE